MPMATRFKSTILVSDGAVAAPHTDANLKNAWGVAFNPKGFVWVANNGTQTATLYDGNGVVQSLVVSDSARRASGPANPTGIVFNGSTTDFIARTRRQIGRRGVHLRGRRRLDHRVGAEPSTLTHAITVVRFERVGRRLQGSRDRHDANGAAPPLRDRLPQQHDRRLRQHVHEDRRCPARFQDPQIPANFAPFGIQAIGAKLYVTYAQAGQRRPRRRRGRGPRFRRRVRYERQSAAALRRDGR